MLCKAIYLVTWYMHCVLMEKPKSLPAGIYDIILLDVNRN